MAPLTIPLQKLPFTIDYMENRLSKSSNRSRKVEIYRNASKDSHDGKSYGHALIYFSKQILDFCKHPQNTLEGNTIRGLSEEKAQLPVGPGLFGARQLPVVNHLDLIEIMLTVWY
jgi:hypothetical protein